MPLTGVVFELSGTSSADIQLCAEAVFLGSPIMRVVGRRVVLSGPTGREPLVGLRVNMEPVNAAAAAREATPPATRPAPARQTPAASEIAAAAAPKSASRVRVFRSRAKKEDPSAG